MNEDKNQEDLCLSACGLPAIRMTHHWLSCFRSLWPQASLGKLGDHPPWPGALCQVLPSCPLSGASCITGADSWTGATPCWPVLEGLGICWGVQFQGGDPLTLSSVLACGALKFAVTAGPVPHEAACGPWLHSPLTTMPSHDHILVNRGTPPCKGEECCELHFIG